ncbi:hypothetical protein PMIN03_005361 [Paraphaeosphaeria minitans]
MFAGSCVGVIFLVLLLEFLRRAGKEYADHNTKSPPTLTGLTLTLCLCFRYDRYILARHTRSLAEASPVSDPSSSDAVNKNPASSTTRNVPSRSFRPTILQQVIRALLHMLQFAVAYFVMLLAMYYNGYIIICIFIGAFLGYLAFGWESFSVSQGGKDRMQEEVTVCCG